MMRFFIGIILFIVMAGNVAAQDIIVRGGFFTDSLRVGDETGYYLSARYPGDLNILFPDSSFNFAPFEFERKRYFPTVTKDGISYDSVIYYLSTFEVDPAQTLSLPVFQFAERDCTIFATDPDTVRLIELAKNIPDTMQVANLPLKVNTAHEDVPYVINYPVITIGVVVLGIVAAVVWIFFGKSIRRHFMLRRMSKAHKQFMESYNRQMETLKAAFSSVHAEHALAQWKQYMEKLEARPYTKLTTRETTALVGDAALGKNLHSIDRAIYGHNTSVIEPLENLRQVADERFAKKLEEVKHG